MVIQITNSTTGNKDEKDVDNKVIVKNSNQLQSIDGTKVYHLDGSINIGSTSIEIPEQGINLGADSASKNVAVLLSNGNNTTMFTSPENGYSGNVLIDGITIICSGQNSKIFDLNNSGNLSTIELTNCNIINTTSLGDLNNFRQVLFERVAFINLLDGLTFEGTWAGGLALLTAITVNFANNAILLKKGTNLVFQGSIRSDINFLSTGADSVLCDFDENNIANAGALSFTNVRTISSNPTPNISASSEKSRFIDCGGTIKNTIIGGEYMFTSEQITVISLLNTFYKIEGTTTYQNLVWFEADGNNSLKYVGEQEIDVFVDALLSFSGNNNKVLEVLIRKYNASTSSYEDLNKQLVTVRGGLINDRAENVTVKSKINLNQNDKIEVWVRNTSDLSNLECLEGSSVFVYALR